jgi:hypothetical protein
MVRPFCTAKEQNHLSCRTVKILKQSHKSIGMWLNLPRYMVDLYTNTDGIMIKLSYKIFVLNSVGIENISLRVSDFGTQ